MRTFAEMTGILHLFLAKDPKEHYRYQDYLKCKSSDSFWLRTYQARINSSPTADDGSTLPHNMLLWLESAYLSPETLKEFSDDFYRVTRGVDKDLRYDNNRVDYIRFNEKPSGNNINIEWNNETILAMARRLLWNAQREQNQKPSDYTERRINALNGVIECLLSEDVHVNGVQVQGTARDPYRNKSSLA